VSCGWCWYLWPYSFQPAPVLVVPARILQPYSLKEAIWSRGYKELTTGLEAASDQLSGESSLRQKLRIGYTLQPTIQGSECVGLYADIKRDTVDGNLAKSMCEACSRSDNVRGRSQRPPAPHSPCGSMRFARHAEPMRGFEATDSAPPPMPAPSDHRSTSRSLRPQSGADQPRAGGYRTSSASPDDRQAPTPGLEAPSAELRRRSHASQRTSSWVL
jgi:hypothetical protein